MHPGRILGLCLTLITAATPLARGDERDDRTARARAAYERGQAHFNLDEFDAAISDFEEAYRNKSDPTFLFNIAQAARLSGKHEMALRFYEKYLRLSPKAPNATAVHDRIAALRKLLAEQRATSDAPPRGSLPPNDVPLTAHAASTQVTGPASGPPKAVSAALTPPAAAARSTPAAPPKETQAPPSTVAHAVPPAALPPPSAVATVKNSPPLKEFSPTPPAPRRRSAARSWWPWTLLGVGLAAGGGAALGLTVFGNTPVPSGDYGPVSLGLYGR